MGVFSPSTTKLTLKWVSLGVALLLLLHWGVPSVDAHEDNMYEENWQQQRRGSCDPQEIVFLPGLLGAAERAGELLQRIGKNVSTMPMPSHTASARSICILHGF